MAIGDVVSAYSNDVADDGYLSIQPASGNEWVIHNIYHAGAVEMYWYDGTNELLFDQDSGGGVFARFAFHCTNSIYIRVKNVNGAAADIGYDGIVTKTT